MRIDLDITFKEAKTHTLNSLKRISKQTTVRGLFAEVRAFANYMIALEKRSPIVATFVDIDELAAIDVSAHPRLNRMKQELVEELLARGDAGGRSYYTANPKGSPFKSRVVAAPPALDAFLRIASLTSRKANRRALRSRRRRM